MAIKFLDQIGAFLSSLGLDPALTSIAVAFFLAILPGLRRGYLDNRLESFVENIDYGLAILSIGFLLAFYFQYGVTGLFDEILGITGGFVLGTFVVMFIQRVTGVKG